MEFDIATQSVLGRLGFKQRASNQLLELWAFFVDQCVDGYDWTLCEYDDELSIRDHIEAICSEPSVKALPDFKAFAQRVEEIDERFKHVLQPGVKRPWPSGTWWRTGVLKYSGDEYRSDMASRYSIMVEQQD